jgi:predicted nuclease of restriction endonuclease-like (RecB) superfamily
MKPRIPELNDPPATASAVRYTDWLAAIKTRVVTARQRAALAVNAELVQLYWNIGHDILQRQARQGWGSKVIDRLAQDLHAAFPDTKGFSSRNLNYMRAFAEAWPDEDFVQQAVAQLPWGHNVLLLTKLKDPTVRLRYAQETIAGGWSRSTLEANIRDKLLERS